jgi:sugar phosphate isomerase/epimerase
MIRPGICSLTLPKKSVGEITEIAKKAGLEGIEWWGKDHVPHGDTSVAEKVKKLTESAGLKVSSYGSYYRAGISESDGLSFRSVLDTAVALGAPSIRIWAGNRNYADAGGTLIKQVVSDTMRIADMAARAGLMLTFEFHGGTLTNTNEGAVKFASLLEHPAVSFSWQPPQGYSTECCLAGLEALLPRLNTVHVFQWTLTAEGVCARHSLASGVDRWSKYFNLIGRTGRDHFALLEFVKDDSPEQVIEDAAALRKLLCM